MADGSVEQALANSVTPLEGKRPATRRKATARRADPSAGIPAATAVSPRSPQQSIPSLLEALGARTGLLVDDHG